MELKITRETSWELNKKLDFLEDVSDLFSKHSFGNGLDTIFIVLHSINPEIGIGQDFETGLLVYKKHVKSKKYLEFKYKLNYKQIMEAQTREETLFIILEGFKSTYNEIKALNIKDFDIDKFYSVVASVIENFANREFVPKEKFFVAQLEEKRELSKDLKMKEVIFWEIIEQSKEERKNFEHQAEILINKLSRLSEKEIVAFEFTFREILAKSAHYNVLAAIKIIEGHVSDDIFLYFRCRLIAEGKEFYFKAIENPDHIADNPIQGIDGESMLSITDKAFIKKVGENMGKELPREIVLSYMNYDEGEEILGESWEEKDLLRKYPKLWKRYIAERP